MNTVRLPKLLLPAGTPEAAEAAIHAGADEIYLGGKAFNARLGADNFTNEQIAETTSRCHFFGVSVFVTLNTLLLDRELSDALRFAEYMYAHDVDGLIVTDPGLTAALRARFPDMPLHASTQCGAHNYEAVKLLAKRGFSRVVLSRECSREDIAAVKKACPDMQYEIFVHGALCVCHSGMCEYSANLGGRSGNRGQCAQPCRLPYANGGYPLSLKDNCLASHIPDIIRLGVDSLKVEGRMKSPEYVYGVGKIYRRLLDEERGASAEELESLSSLFSRGGFTDGYYNGKISQSMLGVRSEEDKAKTAEAETTSAYELRGDKRKYKVALTADLRVGAASKLTLSACGKTVTVYGDVPQNAITSPLTVEDAVKNLCRFGNTDFRIDKDAFSLYLSPGISLPISSLNSLRRTAAEKLKAQIPTVFYPERRVKEYIEPTREPVRKSGGCALIAHFADVKSMPTRQALGQFSHIFLPIRQYLSAPEHIRAVTDGVEISPVVMSDGLDELEELLIRVKLCGCKHVQVSNIGALRLALKYGFTVHGGLLMNVYNSRTTDVMAREGFASVLLSPELNLSQIKALTSSSRIPTGTAVYGKLPMMVLEKCVIKDINGSCNGNCDGFAYLTDRTGAKMPVKREYPHRNILYNSVPVYMADRMDSVTGGAVGDLHFFFTDESASEAAGIVDAYINKIPSTGKIKRL